MKKDEGVLVMDEYVIKPDDSCLKATFKYMAGGAITGTAASIIIAQNYENRAFLETAGRSIARYIFPAVLIGATFASTTCLLDDIRGRKYQVSNAALGGALAGAVLGTKTHSPGKVVKYAFMLGLLGGFARACAVNGYVIYDQKARLEDINKTLFTADLQHLTPGSKE